jgi:hypothetical protein
MGQSFGMAALLVALAGPRGLPFFDSLRRIHSGELHMNWTTWLKGLAAAAIGGAAAGASAALGNGQLNVTTAVTAGIGALTTLLAYLLKSPLGGTPVPAPPAAPPAPSGATS